MRLGVERRRLTPEPGDQVTGDGLHLLRAGEDGEVVVARIGPKFEVLATNTMDETFFASPAIVGNELFLRSDTSLYCISR